MPVVGCLSPAMKLLVSNKEQVMKLAIFGATGSTGKLLVEQALAAGHEVVVLLRDPAKFTTVHERLTMVSGDITNPATVERVVAGADAVVSALGPRADTKGKLITQGTQNILAVVQKHNALGCTEDGYGESRLCR
jgi:putative NADH-flavin reductase